MNSNQRDRSLPLGTDDYHVPRRATREDDTRYGPAHRHNRRHPQGHLRPTHLHHRGVLCYFCGRWGHIRRNCPDYFVHNVAVTIMRHNHDLTPNMVAHAILYWMSTQQ
ncbi:hypothetical protein N7457_006174 [Penicillium paradoxum]|uniref:uncharacterized protein n=1 Tax=Penicillium paradoxum TaxID=176176 RepID=UPI002549BC89|nr:uncharacterized protein N7457_006174 [Penicillium paradoxum]KAJ5781014.1 hypothetical protein N7457_006174 [Penicillium paradoxum]